LAPRQPEELFFERYDSNFPGGIMASTTNAAPAQQSGQKKKAGYFVQLGGIAAFAVGVILSAHHIAIGAAFVGGTAAFYVGQKIRSMA
jgi:hypothetical protein